MEVVIYEVKVLTLYACEGLDKMIFLSGISQFDSLFFHDQQKKKK